MRCSLYRIYHLLGIAMVCCNQQHTASFLHRCRNLTNTAIHRFHRFLRSFHNTGMAYHVGIGKVDQNKRIVAAFDGLEQMLFYGNGTHLRLQIVGGNLWRRHQQSVFQRIWLFHAAVKKECHMGIFFCFGHAELFDTVGGQHLPQGVLQILRRKGNGYIQAILILGHSHKMHTQILPRKAGKVPIHKGFGDLSGPVPSEIKEDDAITGTYCGHRRSSDCLHHRRQHKLVGLAFVVRLLHRFHCTGSRLACAICHGAIGFFYPFPAIVPVHGIVAARYGSDFSYAQLLQFFFQLLHKAQTGRWSYIAAIQETMHIHILQPLCRSHLQQPIQVTAVAVHTAR